MGNAKKNPHFSVNLRRVFIHKPPPLQKTIFLIRHGESKWNKAQASGNMLSTLLDRDHALTDKGIRQAEHLNRLWKEEEEHLKSAAIETSLRGDNEGGMEGGMVGDLTSADDSTPAFATGDLLGLDDFNDGASSTAKSHNGGPFVPAMSPPAFAILPALSPALSPTLSPPMNSLASSPALGDSMMHMAGEKDETRTLGRKQVSSGAVSMTTQSTQSLHNLRNQLGASLESVVASLDSDEGDDVVDGDEDDGVGDGDEVDAEPTNEGEEDEDRLNLGRLSDTIGAQFDRPATLNEIKARRQEYKSRFIHADSVYCSPMTRAIETALVGLFGHSALRNPGLHLYSVIREIKGVGGLDSVGVAFGSAISERVSTELESKLGRSRTEHITAPLVHYNDASQTWWTQLSSFDSAQDQHERIGDFISFSRHWDSQCPIFVGHSLFFKAFYSRRLSPIIERIRPELSENLKKYRLGNASVLAVTLLYSSSKDTECTILDADVIFGSGFQKHADGQRHSGDDSSPVKPRIRAIDTKSIRLGVGMVFDKAVSALFDSKDMSDDRDKDKEKDKEGEETTKQQGGGFSSFVKKLAGNG